VSAMERRRGTGRVPPAASPCPPAQQRQIQRVPPPWRAPAPRSGRAMFQVSGEARRCQRLRSQTRCASALAS
jgi:hypothetical protein